jgi:hypothetical protein
MIYESELDKNRRNFSVLVKAFRVHIISGLMALVAFLALAKFSLDTSYWASMLLLLVFLVSYVIYVIKLHQLISTIYGVKYDFGLTYLYWCPIFGVLYSFARISSIATLNIWDTVGKRTVPRQFDYESTNLRSLDAKEALNKFSVIDRMEKYHNAMNLTVAEYLFDKLRSMPNFNALTESDLMKVVSSIANLMFGRENPIAGGSLISLSQAIALADSFVNENLLLLEVAIQSRRVMATIRFGKTGKADINNDYAHLLLERHGQSFPVAANPDTYPLLVNKFIDSLPESPRRAALSLKQKVLTS